MIVEDQALLREGIVALLAENGIDVVAQAEDGPGCCGSSTATSPTWRSATCGCRRRSPTRGSARRSRRAGAIPSSRSWSSPQYVEPVYTGELLAAGESGVGYLLKERVSEVRTFIDAVERVAAGGTALDREVVSALIADRDRQRRPGASSRR